VLIAIIAGHDKPLPPGCLPDTCPDCVIPHRYCRMASSPPDGPGKTMFLLRSVTLSEHND
ncbi:hypothetical protein, partial [Escherichia coli]|uniref:hypothetical protein n=1 Tax=Escherichia coli TaxID=562 RepID=UPI003D789CE7